jgi:hypothetical protein
MAYCEEYQCVDADNYCAAGPGLATLGTCSFGNVAGFLAAPATYGFSLLASLTVCEASILSYDYALNEGCCIEYGYVEVLC